MTNEHNKRLVHRMVEIVNEREFDSIDEVATGPIASEAHQGEWRGHPPTGRRFEAVHEVYVFRVEDGKLASALAAVEDNLTRLQQLGLVGESQNEKSSA